MNERVITESAGGSQMCGMRTVVRIAYYHHHCWNNVHTFPVHTEYTLAVIFDVFLDSLFGLTY